MEGPAEAEMVCRDNRDGSCTVEYTTETPGDYDIAVKFADTHIPGSPFKVAINSWCDLIIMVNYGWALSRIKKMGLSQGMYLYSKFS